MRLNFSASTADEIREGIRRIGRVVSEQVALYETMTDEPPRPRLRVRAAVRTAEDGAGGDGAAAARAAARSR